jgi:hypothetical protein
MMGEVIIIHLSSTGFLSKDQNGYNHEEYTFKFSVFWINHEEIFKII